MVLEDIAQKIVENTTEIIGYPISITNDEGYIIGSTDPNRLGSFHKPSLDVLKMKKTICYEREEVKVLQNVLPGVATPFFFNNDAIGVLGIVGDPVEVKKYAQLVKSHVEMMCHESFKKEMSVIESKTLDTLIQYLINPDHSYDSEHIIQYGRMLGYNLNLSRICILIEISVMELNLPIHQNEIPDKYSYQYLQKDLIDNLKYYLIDNNQDMISLLTLDQFIILKTVGAEENIDIFIKRMRHNIQRLHRYLTVKYNLTACSSIGSIKVGINGIRESYQDAMNSLNAGKKAKINSQIYYYNDWEITLELLAKGLNPYIANKIIEDFDNLIKYDNYATLATTFMTYCKSNMNLSEAARSLFLHRNSLVYRLEKIGELTSLDLSNFEHCLLLYFSIKNYDSKNSNAKDLNESEKNINILSSR